MRRGHEAFILPADKRYLQRMTLQRYDAITDRLAHALDELRRHRDDVNDSSVSVGMQTPYADWTGRAISAVTQSFGNLGSHFQTLINLVGEIDALLEDDRASRIDDKSRVQELERLARDVVAKPSSRVAREALAKALEEE